MAYLKILIFTLLILSFNISFCQDTLTNDSPVLISGKKTKALDKFSEIEITYYLKNNEKDSIQYTIETYSTKVRLDTVLVQPSQIREYRYYKSAPYQIMSDYSYNSDILIKVPLNKIDRISGKRSGVKIISGFFVFFSTLGMVSAGPIAVFSKSKEQKQLFYAIGGISLLTFATSVTINFRPGKKIFHFDPNRTTKRIWMLK